MARNDLLYSFLQTLALLVFTNADSHGVFVNNCLEFHRVLVQEYDSILETASFRQNYSTRSPHDSQNISLFGTSPSDWTKLILLRDALPEDSTIRKNFKHLFTILLVAHDQALKINRSSQQQDVVHNFEIGKSVSSSRGENTSLFISLDTESHSENSSIMTETPFSAPIINDRIANPRIEAGGKILTSTTEKAREIVGLKSFNLADPKIPFVAEKELEESVHLPNSDEELSKFPETRDKALCNRSSNAHDYAQPPRNNRSQSIENGKNHQFNSSEDEKKYSLQSSTFISEPKNLNDTTTSRSFSFETKSSDDLSTIPRKQENGKRDSTQFFEEFSSPRTSTNDQSLPYEFLTLTENSNPPRSTDQQLGTRFWTDFSTETEKYLSPKTLSSTSTPPILTSTPSDELATEEQVQKYPWEIANDSLLKIKPPMTTPTYPIPTSKRNEIKKVWKPRGSWLEDEIPTEASIVDFKSNINLSSLPNLQGNHFQAKEERIEKSDDTDFSTKLKTDSNNLNVFVSNQTKAEPTPEAYSRYGEDCKLRTQKSPSVSVANQTEMVRNSWNERGSIILETSNKNDEIKTTNFSDQMENSSIAKSISINNVKLLTESSIFADNEKNVGDVQSPNYGEKFKIPEQVPQHWTIRNKPGTDNSSNNFPSIKSSPEKPEAIGTSLRNENSTERHDIGTAHRIKDTATVTMPTETSSPSILREPLIPLLKEKIVKNAVRPILSRNNQISRDYKHDVNDFGSFRKKLEDRPGNVYEFGVSAKNRSFWRQKLDENLNSTVSDLRRFESREGNSRLINIEEKSSKDTESNVSITKESNDSSKSPTHGRINELTPRKRDSENGGIEQRFSWFYRQGQTEDRSKSSLEEKVKTKIKVCCKNPRH